MLDLNAFPQDSEAACLEERPGASTSHSTSTSDREGPRLGTGSIHGHGWSTDRALGGTHGALAGTHTHRGVESTPATEEPSTLSQAPAQPADCRRGAAGPAVLLGGLPPGTASDRGCQPGTGSGRCPGSMDQKRKVPGIVPSFQEEPLRHLKELAVQQAWEEEPAQRLLIPSGVKGSLSSSWILLGQELWAKGMTLGLERFAQQEREGQQEQGQEHKQGQEQGQGQDQDHRMQEVVQEEKGEGSHADVQRREVHAAGPNKQSGSGMVAVASEKWSSIQEQQQQQQQQKQQQQHQQQPGIGRDRLLDLNDSPVASLREPGHGGARPHSPPPSQPPSLIPSQPCLAERSGGPRHLGFNLNLSAEPAQEPHSPEGPTMMHSAQQEEQLRGSCSGQGLGQLRDSCSGQQGLQSCSGQQDWLSRSREGVQGQLRHDNSAPAFLRAGPQGALPSPVAGRGGQTWSGGSGASPTSSASETCDALKRMIGARIQPGIQPGMQPGIPSGAAAAMSCTKSSSILSTRGAPAGANRPTSSLSLVHRLAATIELLQTKQGTPGDQRGKDKATLGQLADGKRRRVDLAVVPLPGLAHASLASASLAHASLAFSHQNSGAGPMRLQVMLPASLGQPGRPHGPHGMAQGQAVSGLHNPQGTQPGLHVVYSGPVPVPRLPIGSWGRSKGRGVEEGVRRKLVAAAEALDRRDMTVFKELSQQLRGFGKKRGSAFERVVFLLVQALTLRAEGKGSEFISKASPYTIQDLENGRMWYYTATPYCLFATIAISGMILPKLIGRRKVHIVNIGEVSLPQWPAILKLLAGGSEASRSPGPGSEASRSSGPGSEGSRSPGGKSPWIQALGAGAGAPGQGHGQGPVSPSSNLKRFRYTNINCNRLSRPRRFDLDMLKGQGRVASVLSAAAEALGVEFYFQGLDLEEDTLGLLDLIEHRADETLVVVMGYDLKFFSDHESLGGGARQCLMQCVRRLEPDLVAVVEDDAPLNQPHFLPRFRSCIDVHSACFETHDLVVQHDSKKFMHTFEQQYHGITLVSVVACEGRERRIRPTTRGQREEMFREQGFLPCALSPLLAQSEHELLRCYPEGFGVLQEPGAVVLTWKGFPMASANAWTLKGSPSPSC